jgi:hypothetical protein
MLDYIKICQYFIPSLRKDVSCVKEKNKLKKQHEICEHLEDLANKLKNNTTGLKYHRQFILSFYAGVISGFYVIIVYGVYNALIEITGSFIIAFVLGFIVVFIMHYFIVGRKNRILRRKSKKIIKKIDYYTKLLEDF